MKTKRFVKLVQVSLALTIVVALVCALGVYSYANDGAGVLSIGDTNLKYDTNTHIIVTVDGTAPDGYDKGIAVWSFDVDEPTQENVSYFNFDKEFDANDVEFFSTEGIPASELSEVLYIAPATRDADGNAAVAGEIVTRSAFGYVTERLSEDKLAAYQIELYRDLVVYGTAAEQVLGDGVANNNVVVAKNGYVGDTYMPMVITEETTALLRASVQNVKGEYFSHWEDMLGNFVSGQRLVSVAVESGLNYYNAVYTTKAASAYGGFVDMQSFELGQLDFGAVYSDLTEGQITAGGYCNSIVPFYTKSDGSFSGPIVSQQLDITDTTLEPLPVISTDVAEIKANYDGLKYLDYQRLVKYANGSNYAYMGSNIIDFRNKSDWNVYDRYEIDLSVSASSYMPTNYVRFVADSGTTRDVYFNVARFTQNGVPCFRLAIPTTAGERNVYVPDEGGKGVISLAVEIGDDGYAVIYVNGKAVELDARIKFLNDYAVAAGNYHPVYVQWELTKAGTLDYDVYSYGFVDTDKLVTK